MKRFFIRLCERLDILDLLRLLSGHFFEYRHPGLQDLAVQQFLEPRASSARTVGIVHLTVQIRRWTRVHTYARWRYWRSRAKRTLRRARARSPSAPDVTFSLLCPSRDRAHRMQVLMESVCRTAERPERVEVLCYVDDDDPSLGEYRRLFADADGRFRRLKRCELVVGESMTVGKLWNVLARRSAGDVLMMANDDQMYLDYAWDAAAEEELRRHPDEIVCLFFDDGQYLPERGDFPMVSRRWFEELGYFTPEIFQFWTHELWIMDIAERIGRLQRVHGIRVDHLHYDQYLAVFDETYRRHRLDWMKSEQDGILFRQTAEQRESAAEKLRRLMR